MAKFVLLNQRESLKSQTGASGEKYVSNRGKPFKVTNKEDIEYFSSFPKRFKKVGLLERGAEPEKDVDAQLTDKLSSIKGVSKKSVSTIVTAYHSEEKLMDAIENGYDLSPEVPDRQKEAVRKFFLEQEGMDRPEEDEQVEETEEVSGTTEESEKEEEVDA